MAGSRVGMPFVDRVPPSPDLSGLAGVGLVEAAYPDVMVAPRMLVSGPYSLDCTELYSRLWGLAEDLGDGTRLYASDGDASLKWVIAELSGTPAEAGKTLPDNNALRKQVHALLI